MRSLFVLAAMILLGAASANAAALAVVMAIDVSDSVTAVSYILQRDGIARAFEDPRLVTAIAAAPGGIEALVLEWSDPDKIAVTVGWTRITSRHSAAAFAAAVHATTRSSRGLTAIGAALSAAAAQFNGLPQPAARRVIDISGDGMANLGPPPEAARDTIVKAGITINGLAILSEEPWLEDYYRRNVIGGAGAFVLAASEFHSFADAMLRKLEQEIAGERTLAVARDPALPSGDPPSGGKVSRSGD
jgi:Ca-activated chloride channel homolog